MQAKIEKKIKSKYSEILNKERDVRGLDQKVMVIIRWKRGNKVLVNV